MNTYNEDRLQAKINDLLRERGVVESLVHDLNHKLGNYIHEYLGA